MPPVVLDILKYLFLFLIFLFLARAVRAMYLEIAGPRTRAEPRSAGPLPKIGRPPEKMAVVAPDEKPRTFDVGDELLIGRSEKCQVVITDVYASQIHARVFRRDGQVFIEDMGSTNGTYLNDKKVKATLPVNRGDRGRIGKTELEFRK